MILAVVLGGLDRLVRCFNIFEVLVVAELDHFCFVFGKLLFKGREICLLDFFEVRSVGLDDFRQCSQLLHKLPVFVKELVLDLKADLNLGFDESHLVHVVL